MNIINLSEMESKGMPMYDMRRLFNADGAFENMTFSYIALQPGLRIPPEGFSCHDADEYSYFVSGEVFTYSGGEEVTVKAGQATLIPKGEKHWCINRGTEPCVIICAMLK